MIGARELLFTLFVFLSFSLGRTDNEQKGDDTGIHVITLIDEENESKDLDNYLLHSVCRLNYQNVKVLRKWCSSGSCEDDLPRLQALLSDLPPNDWAVVVNPGNEFVYLMASPELATEKLLESGRSFIVAAQPKKVEDPERDGKNREEDGAENTEKGNSKENDDEDENKIKLEDVVTESAGGEEDPLMKVLRGGTILGRVDAVRRALEAKRIPEGSLVDTSAQLVLFGNRLMGSFGVEVPINTRFIPEVGGDDEATSPFVIYSLEDKLDFYNIIQFGGPGPEYCPFTKEQPLPQKEEKPRILVSLDISGNWVPFLEEILQGLQKQNYPKDRMDVWVHAKSGVQEKEVQQFVENGGGYSSISINTEESVDMSSLRLKCVELSCDYLMVMESNVLLDNSETIPTLIASNRPVVAPFITEMKSKQAKSNMVYSYEGDSQWDELISKRTVKGTFQVAKVRNIVMYRRDAVDRVQEGGKVKHYINNELSKVGYLLDFRGYKEGKLHPDLWGMRHNKFIWIRRYIHPDVLQVIKKEKKPETVGPYLYYLPFFTERYCREMIEEMEHHGKWFDKEVDDREEAAHHYSSRNINFEEIGYADDYHIVLNSVHKELLSALYGNFKGVAEASLIFVLKYASAAKYGTFKYHLDGATYTLNIALNNGFTGGGIQYKLGNRYFGEEVEIAVPHNRTGWAVIQPDRPLHSHKGVALESGTRYAMINIIDTNDEFSKGGPKWVV
ncbi:procollagen-lysine,2-oxoglutarate 5-dioxygenase 1-like isoform X1 [Macrobrachium nipponense]|uniref:procollagen-lysine,2-oxoglutarate 5-dioxygenase 1-like isoform X1 n=2 Tax=Macrobrachium nipponense TaxID=159736 RepID=UPI0030C7BD33